MSKFNLVIANSFFLSFALLRPSVVCAKSRWTKELETAEGFTSSSEYYNVLFKRADIRLILITSRVIWFFGIDCQSISFNCIFCSRYAVTFINTTPCYENKVKRVQTRRGIFDVSPITKLNSVSLIQSNWRSFIFQFYFKFPAVTYLWPFQFERK